MPPQFMNSSTDDDDDVVFHRVYVRNAATVHKRLKSLHPQDQEKSCDDLIRSGTVGKLSDELCEYLLSSINLNCDKDIFLVLYCIEFMYRYCSESVLRESFDVTGHSLLLPLLLEVIENYSTYSDGDTNCTDSTHEQYAQPAISMSLKIIYHFSCLDHGHQMMGRQRGYIDNMVKIISHEHHDMSSIRGQQIYENMCLVIRILMSYDQKYALVRCSDVLDSVMLLLECRWVNELGGEIYDLIAMLFYNMMDGEEKTQLYLVHFKGFLNYVAATLIEICDKGYKNMSCNWQSLHLSKVLCLISEHEANVEQLVFFENGKILEALTKMILNDVEASRASKVVYNLMMRNDIVGSRLNEPKLIYALATTALSCENANGKYAAKAVEMIIRLSSYDVFQKTVFMLSSKSNFCLCTALDMIKYRMNESKSSKLVCAKDECIISLIMTALRNENYSCVSAANILQLICSDTDCLCILRNHPSLIETLSSITIAQESLLDGVAIGESLEAYNRLQECATLASICYCNLLAAA